MMDDCLHAQESTYNSPIIDLQGLCQKKKEEGKKGKIGLDPLPLLHHLHRPDLLLITPCQLPKHAIKVLPTTCSLYY